MAHLVTPEQVFWMSAALLTVEEVRYDVRNVQMEGNEALQQPVLAYKHVTARQTAVLPVQYSRLSTAQR